MKQLFALLALTIALSVGRQTQAQQLRYYYYPSSNVYYDIAHKTYIYPSGGAWVTRRTLPSRRAVLGGNRVVVYSSTPEVWRNNATHLSQYRGKSAGAPYGRAVGYKGSNANKAMGKPGNPGGKGRGKHAPGP